jgi:hypothetical protein
MLEINNQKSDGTFKIICPSCRKPNNWKNHPSDYAIATIEEFDKIYQGIIGGKKLDRLLHCSQPKWKCPAPFEALIFSKEDVLLYAADIISDLNKWYHPRDFRLFKGGESKLRWDNPGEGEYYGLIFSLKPVDRERDICLSYLIDENILNLIMSGIINGLGYPVKVYGFSIFEGDDWKEELWLSHGPHFHSIHNTERLNPFCQVCFEKSLSELYEKYNKIDASLMDCQYYSCWSKETPRPCFQKNWEKCKLFIKERNSIIPCFRTDSDAIAKFQKLWVQKKITERFEYQCPFGFCQQAFPITVHGHLAGILILGPYQKESFPPELDKIIDKWDILRPHQGEMIDAKSLTSHKTFPIRVEDIYLYIGPVTELLNTRYVDIRSYSEDAFLYELIYYMNASKNLDNFFGKPILEILNRMRKFWAFNTAALLSHNNTDGKLKLIAFSSNPNKEKTYGLSGIELLTIHENYRQKHPLPWFYDSQNPENSRNPWIRRFSEAINELERFSRSTGMERKCYYTVCMNASEELEELYAFVFGPRDLDNLSRCPAIDRGWISDLGREFILRTCSEFFLHFKDFKSIDNLRKKIKRPMLLDVHQAVGRLSHIKRDLEGFGTHDGTIDSQIDQFQRQIDSIGTQLQRALCVPSKQNNEEVGIIDLLRNCLNSLQEQRYTLNCEGNVQDIKLAIDKITLENAFNVFIDNFQEHCPPESHLSIKIIIQQRAICIVFSDDGPGMSCEAISSVKFQPRGGERLRGLHLAKEFIEHSGGVMTISSENNGTKIEIKLPLRR